MSGSEHESSSGRDRELAHGGAGGTAPGKSTVSGKMSGGKKRTVEEKLEAVEEQNDTILVAFAPYLAAHMTKPDAPEAAAKVRTQLMKLRALADDLKRSRSTAKRKGLESAVNDALTAADVTLLTQGALVARLLDNGDDIKQAWSAQDAFGVHREAKEREPEADPAPAKTGWGIPVVDEGYLCEREGVADDKSKQCEATPLDRRDLNTELSFALSVAMNNMQKACTRVMLQEVLSTESGWNGFCEFVFASITGPLIGQAIKGLGFARKAVEARKNLSFSDLYHGVTAPKGALDAVARLDDREVIAILTNVSKAVRTEFKAAFKSEGNRHKVEFVEMFENKIGPFVHAVRDQALTMLDDADLAEFARAFKDDTVHGVPAYEEIIQTFANRYVAQDIPKIGAPQFGNRTLRLVKLVAFGYERMATLEEDTQEGQPKRTPEGNRTYFHDFVDEEFAGVAQANQVGRRGKDANAIDVTHGYFFAVHETPKDVNDQRWMNERNYTGMIAKLETLDAWIESCRRRAEGERGAEDVDFAQQRREDQVVGEPEDVDSEYREEQQEESS